MLNQLTGRKIQILERETCMGTNAAAMRTPPVTDTSRPARHTSSHNPPPKVKKFRGLGSGRSVAGTNLPPGNPISGRAGVRGVVTEVKAG